jgi:hypothetical protein
MSDIGRQSIGNTRRLAFFRPRKKQTGILWTWQVRLANFDQSRLAFCRPGQTQTGSLRPGQTETGILPSSDHCRQWKAYLRSGQTHRLTFFRPRQTKTGILQTRTDTDCHSSDHGRHWQTYIRSKTDTDWHSSDQGRQRLAFFRPGQTQISILQAMADPGRHTLGQRQTQNGILQTRADTD